MLLRMLCHYTRAPGGLTSAVGAIPSSWGTGTGVVVWECLEFVETLYTTEIICLTLVLSLDGPFIVLVYLPLAYRVKDLLAGRQQGILDKDGTDHQ